MVEKIKTDLDRLLLILTMKKSFPMYSDGIELFSISKPKVVYFSPFLSTLPSQKFRNENPMYFRHKHVETQNQLNLLIS